MDFNKNYYEILGITEDEKKLQGKDFEDVVKKKFKKLSMKWHPDRWVSGTDEEKKTAEEKFKEINEAKTILEDSHQRAIYDGGGEPQFEDGGFNPFGGGFNPFDIFGGRQRQKRGTDINVTVNLSFEEAYNGCNKTVSVPHEKPCSHCNGTGSADKKSTVCPHCNGTGQYVKSSIQGNMHYQQVMPCPHCHGTGKINPNPCPHCHGTGKEYEYTDKTINIPAGILNGITLQIQGEGNPIDGGINGNLLITVMIAPNPYFEVVNEENGINLLHIEEIPFNEAILGCEKEIKLPNGKTEKLKIKECTKDNELYTLNEKGYPIFNPYTGQPSSQKGNYGILIKYKYPDKLTDEQKEKLKNF